MILICNILNDIQNFELRNTNENKYSNFNYFFNYIFYKQVQFLLILQNVLFHEYKDHITHFTVNLTTK